MLAMLLVSRAHSSLRQILPNSTTPFAKFRSSPWQILGIPRLTTATHFRVHCADFDPVTTQQRLHLDLRWLWNTSRQLYPASRLVVGTIGMLLWRPEVPEIAFIIYLLRHSVKRLPLAFGSYTFFVCCTIVCNSLGVEPPFMCRAYYMSAVIELIESNDIPFTLLPRILP